MFFKKPPSFKMPLLQQKIKISSKSEIFYRKIWILLSLSVLLSLD